MPSLAVPHTVHVDPAGDGGEEEPGGRGPSGQASLPIPDAEELSIEKLAYGAPAESVDAGVESERRAGGS